MPPVTPRWPPAAWARTTRRRTRRNKRHCAARRLHGSGPTLTCAKQLDNDRPEDRKTVAETFRYWRQDADLAGLRDAAELAKLPAEEQKAFTQFWSDVVELLKKAQEKPK